MEWLNADYNAVVKCQNVRNMMYWGGGIFLLGSGGYLAYQAIKYLLSSSDEMTLVEPDLDQHQSDMCPLPPILINRIAREEWPILEMCAGDGFNKYQMEEFGIEVRAFDLRGGVEKDELMYGIAGTLEDAYPQYTLMLNLAYDSRKSIERYMEGGGKRVILGGKAHACTLAERWTLRTMDKPTGVEKVYFLERGWDGTSRYLEIRPNPEWMTEHGWVMVDAYYGCSGDSKDKQYNKWVDYFQIWERSGDVLVGINGSN